MRELLIKCSHSGSLWPGAIQIWLSLIPHSCQTTQDTCLNPERHCAGCRQTSARAWILHFRHSTDAPISMQAYIKRKLENFIANAHGGKNHSWGFRGGLRLWDNNSWSDLGRETSWKHHSGPQGYREISTWATCFLWNNSDIYLPTVPRYLK